MNTSLVRLRRWSFGARSLVLLTALLVFAAAGGCGKRPASISVPLKYRPTSQLKLSAFAGDLPDTKLEVAPVNDSRPNKDAVGENLEKEPAVAVQTGDDPTQFVQTRLRDLLSKAGLQIVEEGGQPDRVLQTDLHAFWTKETDTYESEIRATFTLKDRTGRQLWKGTVNGTAERFGRSLSAENYQEVFSDGMVDLVQNLLSNAKFRTALGGSGNASADGGDEGVTR